MKHRFARKVKVRKWQWCERKLSLYDNAKQGGVFWTKWLYGKFAEHPMVRTGKVYWPCELLYKCKRSVLRKASKTATSKYAYL